MKNDPGSIHQKIQAEIQSNGNIGNYKIIYKIGEGAYSCVYLAEHVMTRHVVVLKSTEKNQANLANEVVNMGFLEHPHIVRLYEFIVTPTNVWLVLEYCEGNELFQYLQNRTKITAEKKTKLFAQLSGAVAYSHNMNCAHRDLKLENVFLDSKENIKLGDFGFTRSYMPKTMLETICGTEKYMAPELILRKKYNPECVDVWALGIILYSMIYKKLPFDSDNVVETVNSIIESDPEFPPLEGHEKLIELCKCILQKSPHNRPKVINVLEKLGDLGAKQINILNNIPSRRDKSHFMVTKEERSLLKGMKALNIDLNCLASSIANHKCDPLHGLWFTALDKQLSSNNGRSASKLVHSLSKTSMTPFSSKPKSNHSSIMLSTNAASDIPENRHSMTSIKSELAKFQFHPPEGEQEPTSPRSPNPPLAKSPQLNIDSDSQNDKKQNSHSTGRHRNFLNKFLGLFYSKNMSQSLATHQSKSSKQLGYTKRNSDGNNLKPSTPSRSLHPNDRPYKSSLSPLSSHESPSPSSNRPSVDHSSYQGLGLSFSRQVSTYSQMSQLSQLSQSSAEPSVLLSEVQTTQDPFFTNLSKERSKSIPTSSRRFFTTAASPELATPNRFKFRQFVASDIQASKIDESDIE